jgi:cysteinyl-tRNA synthetase
LTSNVVAAVSRGAVSGYEHGSTEASSAVAGFAVDRESVNEALRSFEVTLLELGGILGLFEKPIETLEVPPEIQALVEARAAARKSRQWAEADRLRDEILSRGYLLEDKADVVFGSRFMGGEAHRGGHRAPA